MPFFPLRHPSLEALSNFTDATASPEQARIAAHMADCAECRRTTQHFRAARAELTGAKPPGMSADLAALRDRVLASRAGGTRIIIPVGSASAQRAPTRPWVTVAVGAAAVMALLLGDAVWSSRREADASITTGTLTMSPSMPRSGQVLQLTYDAPGSLAKYATLTVRARLRSAQDQSYETGIPVRAIAHLARAGDGRYAARVTLPDSIVFAALVVEDSTGTVIDDNNSRTWEVLTTVDGTMPSLAALDQRAHDLMGRNFEEGHATTKRMVALYPDSIQGWSWLASFESWMGIADVDSVRARHQAALKRFDRKWRATTVVPAAILGRLAWYARYVDSTTHRYWRERLMREAPTDGFALQWRVIDVLTRLSAQLDTAAALRTLDTLWMQRTAGRAAQIAGIALPVAIGTARRDLADQWAARVLESSRSGMAAEASVADQFVRAPALAGEGMERMRHALASAAATDVRRLMETTTRRDLRVAAVQRRVLASLGRALVASGATRAGLDTLSLAGSVGWDLQVIRALRTGSFDAGDSATGWSMTARLVADPSIPAGNRDALTGEATRALGTERWSALRAEGTRMFAQRMLEDSRIQSLAGAPRLRDGAGREQTLRAVAAGRVTVVAFWSRFCGWALEDLENLNDVAKRLDESGARMVLVLDDEPAPTPALTAFLAGRKVSTPVWFDVSHTTSKAFNNWGTPMYYVLDEAGRLRFNAVTTAKEALVRAEALRISATY